MTEHFHACVCERCATKAKFDAKQLRTQLETARKALAEIAFREVKDCIKPARILAEEALAQIGAGQVKK